MFRSRIHSQPHVAYTDHVNASGGIVVFYGELRLDFSSLRKPRDVIASTDKRRPRYLHDFLANAARDTIFPIPFPTFPFLKFRFLSKTVIEGLDDQKLADGILGLTFVTIHRQKDDR